MKEEEKTRAEVLLSLIRFTIEEKNTTSEWLEEAVDALQSISFLHSYKESQMQKQGILNYVGSDEFHKDTKIIQASQLKLIKIISNII
jgi:hypothetical protein